jgi:hypothetical protein
LDRLTWLILALVFLLGGLYLRVHEIPDWLVYLVAGVGAGIGLALTGSLIHDAFVNLRQRD